MTEIPVAINPLTVESAREALAEYLGRNPYSTVDRKDETDSAPIINTPWGDRTIKLDFPDDHGPFIAALNNLILPERYSAIWHVDTSKLEVIYTAFPLPDHQIPMLKRKFEFSFRETEYTCEFGNASDRLLTIAEMADVSGFPSRNLYSFKMYLDMKRDGEEMPDAQPLCFWISGLTKWDEELAVDLSRHLNFFMTYYDDKSPHIEVHPPKHEKSGSVPRERYVTGYFPTKIVGREINPNLLHFWSRTQIGDPLRRFQYAYQIIEHVSFYYVEERVKRSLHKALSAPHIHHELERVIVEIMDHVSTTKTWEGTKMQQLLKEAVSCNLVWREIDKNRDYFSRDHTFDGGFKLQGIIADKATEDTFSKNWQDVVTARLRDIRNALSHGREQSTSGVMLPTQKNFSQIAPWLDLATIIAGEVMLFRPAML
jgi:hypothetical protein